MRALLVAAPLGILALALAGCLSAPVDEPPTLDARCASGGAGHVVDAVSAGGFAGPEFLHALRAVDREGRVVAMRVTQGPGEGRVEAAPEALANMTLEEARVELGRFGVWRDDRDFNVTLGARAPLPAADYNRLCRAVADEGFYALAPHYDDPQCADGSTTTLRASTTLGEHATSAYCGAGPEAFRAVEDALAEAARPHEARGT